jgi:hypothetical protein
VPPSGSPARRPSDQHPRAVEVVLADGQRAGCVVDGIGIAALSSAGDHAGAFAVVELGIERALRRGRDRAQASAAAAQRGNAEEPRQHPAAPAGCAAKTAQPRQRAAAGGIGQRRQREGDGGGAAAGTSSLIYHTPIRMMSW